MGLQELVGGARSQEVLKFLGNAFSAPAVGFSVVKGYLRVTWDKLHATHPQIQMGFFKALQKLWH